MGVFMVIMAVVIFSLLSSITPEEGRTKEDELRNGIFSTVAFLLGAITSIVSGYLGMMIATFANARVAVEARKGIAPAFMCGKWRYYRLHRVTNLTLVSLSAFRSGAVMGFLLSSLGLLVLFITIGIFKTVRFCCW